MKADGGIRRVLIEGEVYVRAQDLLQLVDISRDRHEVHGQKEAARAMEGFALGIYCLDTAL